MSTDLYLDLRMSAGTIERAREAVAAAEENRFPASHGKQAPASLDSINAYNCGALKAHCTELANQLERAHSALAGMA